MALVVFAGGAEADAFVREGRGDAAAVAKAVAEEADALRGDEGNAQVVEDSDELMGGFVGISLVILGIDIFWK